MNKRIKTCLKALKENSLDAILLSDWANISYLSGFRKAEGYLLVTKTEGLFYFTSKLYREEAKKIKLWNTVDCNLGIFNSVSKIINRYQIKTVGFEAKKITVFEKNLLSEILSKTVKLVPTLDFVMKLRAVKSALEISYIKKAVEITKEALDFTAEIYDQVESEKLLSVEIEKFMRIKGDNRIAFDTIVASGKNSSLAHHSPKDTKLYKKFFIIDLGAKYYGYCADLTRVFFCGKMPPLYKKVYDTVKKAQELAVNKIRPGVRVCDVDKVARDFIDRAGWGKNFSHGLGHGVGLEVHEMPYLNGSDKTILQEGMVVTVEPAVYLKNKFGVRLEDTVLVGAKKGERL